MYHMKICINVLPAFHVAFHFSSESDNIFPTPYKHLAGAQTESIHKREYGTEKMQEKETYGFHHF